MNPFLSRKLNINKYLEDCFRFIVQIMAGRSLFLVFFAFADFYLSDLPSSGETSLKSIIK